MARAENQLALRVDSAAGEDWHNANRERGLGGTESAPIPSTQKAQESKAFAQAIAGWSRQHRYRRHCCSLVAILGGLISPYSATMHRHCARTCQMAASEF